MKNKYLKKTTTTRCRCNGKLILLCLSIFKRFTFCFLHVFQTSQECVSCDHIAALVSIRFLVPSTTLEFGIEGSARKDTERGVLRTSNKKFITCGLNISAGKNSSFYKSSKYQIISMQDIAYIIFVQHWVRIKPSQDPLQ